MKKYAINLGMSLKGKQTAANQVLSKEEKRTQQGANCEKKLMKNIRIYPH
jgi:hypothetical protein